MRIVIAVPGTYNDERGQPVRCVKGDILTTVAGYGQTLLDADFARPLLERVTPAAPESALADEATVAAEPAPKPAPKHRKKAAD